MTAQSCTCAGTAPGYPQHEAWCDLATAPASPALAPLRCRPGCADEWHMHPAPPPIRLTDRGRDVVEVGRLLLALLLTLALVSAIEKWI